MKNLLVYNRIKELFKLKYFFILFLIVFTLSRIYNLYDFNKNLGGRTGGEWNPVAGSYLKPVNPLGYNILISGSNKYLNFNTVSGLSGYGFRDNTGEIEFKNSDGSWLDIVGGSSAFSIDSGANNGELLYWDNGANKFTLASSSQILWSTSTGFMVLDGLQFDTSFSMIGHSEGLMHWNSDDGTIEIDMPGGAVKQQLGQELFLPRGKAVGSNIDNGQLVYLSGASGFKPELSLAKADASSTALTTIAMATEDIAQNSNGYFTTFGLVRDVPIPTTTFSDGDKLYLSADTLGGFTNEEPMSPNYSVPVGYVITAHNTEGIAFINVDIGTGGSVYGGLSINNDSISTSSAVTTTDGTVTAGTLASLQYIDQDYYTVQETGQFKIDFTFTGLGDIPERIEVVGRYEGNPAHDVFLYIYNYDTTSWDRVTAEAQDFPSLAVDDSYTFSITASSTYLSGDEAQIRIEHDSSSVSSHFMYVDYINITERTLEIENASTYYQLTDLMELNYRNVSLNASSGTITIIDSGDYAFNGSISFSGTSDALINGEVFINGIDSGTAFKRRLRSSGDVGSAAGVSILELNAGDVVDFRFTSDKNDTFISIDQLGVILNKL